MVNNSYSSYEEHQQAWEELAKNIASLKHNVREMQDGEVPRSSKKGSLTIIGTGIESIGVTLADKKLLEEADKVLFCVADPATIVWLKKLRPDALDLYVLYAENKMRYITYMQMTEAQLYWVREGLNVVVAFYGHPGIFVLSTHRAVKIAKREGYSAVMKASVSALDTLCADLGVDPSHPGLQTHEATDSLIRQRHIDTSLHVILWQVGLIGELGYRRQGYLNNNFSYFISWLENIYGSDYEITHYVGSRYPTIEPVIEVYALKELHDLEIQAKITGISTFYIPPKDVIPTDYKIALELGVINENQKLIVPKTPLREIGLYGAREMKAFDDFKNFKIPSSYKWQQNTAASDFLIELRFDTQLQEMYKNNPIKALEDSRFHHLSDKEKALLSSRDSGAIQIAAKGIYLRSYETENSLIHFFTNKQLCGTLLGSIKNLNRKEAREFFKSFCEKKNFKIDYSLLQNSIDIINANNLYPWSGVYVESEQKLIITLIGNKATYKKSVLYINGQKVNNFTFQNGIIKFKANDRLDYNGYLKFDVDLEYKRRVIGKVWEKGGDIPSKNNFIAYEIDPDRKNCAAKSIQLMNSSNLEEIAGQYAIRTNGDFSKDVNEFIITTESLTVNGIVVTDFQFENGKLSWEGANKDCFSGNMTFLIDPIVNSIEVYGNSQSRTHKTSLLYGSKIYNEIMDYKDPKIPEWAAEHLCKIVYENSKKGGLLLWHKWEKHNFNSMVVNRFISNLN